MNEIEELKIVIAEVSGVYPEQVLFKMNPGVTAYSEIIGLAYDKIHMYRPMRAPRRGDQACVALADGVAINATIYPTTKLEL